MDRVQLEYECSALSMPPQTPTHPLPEYPNSSEKENQTHVSNLYKKRKKYKTSWDTTLQERKKRKINNLRNEKKHFDDDFY